MASTSWSQRELLFNEIKKRLTPIREITDVRIWNDHLIDNNNQEWKAPVVFIDFSPDRNMEEYTNNLYRVEQEMVIKVVIENYTLNKLDIYKLTDAVKAYLTGWVAPDFPMEKLVLSRENEDTPFDNLRCINILYNLVTFEQSNPYGIVYVGGTNSCIELELTSGMDSNNDGVTWRNGSTFSGLSYLYSDGCFITGSTGMTGMTGCSFSEIDINNPDFCFTHPFPLMDNCIPMPDDVNSGWDCVSTGFGGGQGPRGYQGPKGSQGSKGSTGSTGSQGVQGSTGPQGSNGLDGVIGVDGATGPQGFQGSQGLPISIQSPSLYGSDIIIGSTAGVVYLRKLINLGGIGLSENGGVLELENQHTKIVDMTDTFFGTLEEGDVIQWDGFSWINNNVSKYDPMNSTTPLTATSISGAINELDLNKLNSIDFPAQFSFEMAGKSTADLVDSLDRRYVTDAQLAQIGQGSTGPQGLQGFQGRQGSTGPQGSNGLNGPQGSIGPQGFQGNDGVGLLGPQGPQGNIPDPLIVDILQVNQQFTLGSLVVASDITNTFTVNPGKIFQSENVVSTFIQTDQLYGTNLEIYTITSPLKLRSTSGGTLFQWPVSDGSNRSVMMTDGSGQLSLQGLTPSDVGLDQVDNTSDANKPISIATQNALNGKVNIPLYFVTNTTNNSLTNIVPISIALDTNKSIRYHLKGRSTTTGNRFAAECWFEADNTGGVVTLIGTLSIDRKSTFTNAVQTSVTISGSNVNINITGPNGQTVVWELYVREIL